MPFCHACGAEVHEKAVICVKCGAALAPMQFSGATLQVGPTSDKEWTVTLLLCLFLGTFGVHRFYTGHIGIGVIQLLTFGGCGIWTLIDLIMIITGGLKDVQGRPLRK